VVTICLITYAPPGVTPERDHLLNGVKLNPHGSGGSLLVPDGGGILTTRSMDGVSAVDMFLDLRKHFPAAHAVFHSRYATADNITEENIQPFVTDGDLAIAHNGYLFPVDSDRSDTRVLADELLPRWNLDIPLDRFELEIALGWNKLVILSASPAYKEPVYILNEQQGVHEGDLWYSNEDYLGGEGHRAKALREDRCGVCGALWLQMSPIPGTRVCAHCQSLAEQRYDRLGEGANG
jgi:hypothetical protein